MAKKKAINYNPNAALIQGAGVAYKNWENVPGMYAGFDKAIKGGIDTMKAATEGFIKKQEKIQADHKAFNDAAEKVLLESGSLSKNLYDATYNELVKAKAKYVQGLENKDQKMKMEGMMFIQNHSAWVQDHKQANLDFAKLQSEGKLSKAHLTGQGYEDMKAMTKIFNGEYTKTSRNEQGDIQFHLETEYDVELTEADYEAAVNEMSGEGVPDNQIPTFEEWKKQTRKVGVKERIVSSKEYEDMPVLKYFDIGVSYMDGMKDQKTSRDFDEIAFGTVITKGLPTNLKQWDAAMADGVFGGEGDDTERLTVMLQNSFEKGNLEQRIKEAVGEIGFKLYAGDDGVLSEAEKQAFIDIATDSSNPAFNLDRSNKILKEMMETAAIKQHKIHWEKKDRATTEQYEKRFGISNPPEKIDNYLVGRQGNLFNPATAQEEYAGYIKNKAGRLLYDDKAISAFIQTGEEFEDAFGNQYKPYTDKKGKVIGYNIIDGVTGKYLKLVDKGKTYGNNLMITKHVAYRNAVGKGTLTGLTSGNKKYD